MQDKIRKIFRWIWNNKERMVLVIMVGLLMYQVWQVIYPPPQPTEAELRAPMSPPPPEALPPQPSVRPAPSVFGDYAMIHQRNPFWYYGRTEGGSNRDAAVDIPIELIRIREVNGRPRAQLRTATTTQWYYEGEEFEEFQLLEIDQENQSVTVYAERLGRRKTLSLAQ